MSDRTTSFIPVDPRYVPEVRAQASAADTLREFAPKADEVWTDSAEGVVFRDCGGNFESVRCPQCSAEITTEVWHGWMDADFSEPDGLRLDPLVLDCCGSSTTLNGLVYDWPQGFSRYMLSVRNGGLEHPQAVMPELEQILGCKLRMIRQKL